ncbi:hypothetical protein CGRA01v4_05691 [Colletotrichum graminicola]|nr:hypothetical protein CGRA01v4_05691 [Colletotrichum graminicola]
MPPLSLTADPVPRIYPACFGQPISGFQAIVPSISGTNAVRSGSGGSHKLSVSTKVYKHIRTHPAPSCPSVAHFLRDRHRATLPGQAS